MLGASSLTGRYWYGSLWFYEIAAHGPDVEKCTAGVQLEAGIDDAIWIDQDKTLIGLDTGKAKVCCAYMLYKDTTLENRM